MQYHKSEYESEICAILHTPAISGGGNTMSSRSVGGSDGDAPHVSTSSSGAYPHLKTACSVKFKPPHTMCRLLTYHTSTLFFENQSTESCDLTLASIHFNRGGDVHAEHNVVL